MLHGAEPAIEAKGLWKRYGAASVLRGVNLTVPTGSAVALFGPNGAGKSTLLGIVASLIRPTAGIARIFGVDTVKDGPRARSFIGMLSHAPWVYERMTVRDNLEFFARIYDVSDGNAISNGLMEDLGLAELADAETGTLSRGMKQRLGIARALLHRPPLLLLDEPFTGLDRNSSALLTDRLLAFRQEGGTLLIVTHHIEEGWQVADKAVALVDGEIALETPITPEGLPAFAAWYDDRTRGEER
jgi:heme ABC exporter ATP-binding subunit CcmA